MAKMMLVTSQLVDLEHTLAFHKPIMHAIEKRDGDLAARLMQEHLEDARQLLIRKRDAQSQSRLAPPKEKRSGRESLRRTVLRRASPAA